jgi:NAD(P)-dependent dehydrogenase (short-subunit alcohol dehydrogenase family)
MLLKTKNILVVGGSGKLGKEIVSAVLETGGNIWIADLKTKILDEQLSKLKTEKNTSVSVESLFLDITNQQSVQDSIRYFDENNIRLDGVVICSYPRNANFGRKFEDVDPVDFNDNITQHLGGYFSVIQAYTALLKKHKKGSIVAISSIYGSCTPRFDLYENLNMTMPIEYAAIKSGIDHIIRYCVNYFKSSGIRFNTVSPGGIIDGQDEEFVRRYSSYCSKKGMLDAKDVTGTVIFLLSDYSEFVTGQNIKVDDGFSL